MLITFRINPKSVFVTAIANIQFIVETTKSFCFIRPKDMYRLEFQPFSFVLCPSPIPPSVEERLFFKKMRGVAAALLVIVFVTRYPSPRRGSRLQRKTKISKPPRIITNIYYKKNCNKILL